MWFLHELASLLIIDSPLRGLLAAAPDPDLCRYLVLAHHGRLRMRVLESPGDATPEAAVPSAPGARVIFGLEHGAVSVVPPMLGLGESQLTVDLAQFGSGGDDSTWYQATAGLLGKYGPFRLAYLETLVRIADWRASGHRELPGVKGGFPHPGPTIERPLVAPLCTSPDWPDNPRSGRRPGGTREGAARRAGARRDRFRDDAGAGHPGPAADPGEPARQRGLRRRPRRLRDPAQGPR